MNLLEEVSFGGEGDEFGQFYKDQVANVQHDIIKLDNGADALFLRRGDLDASKKHPMLVLLHGGPFGSSPYQMFLAGRQ